MAHPPLLDELAWRGLVYQHTDQLAEALAAGPVTAYAGFDPTGPSLHVGHLVPVMGLAHLQRAGHRPIALVGGGTGLIGDPSGKNVERQLNSPELVAENARSLRRQLELFLDFSGPRAALMRDNAEWLAPLGAIEFMRDVGKHFTVNYMTAKDSVRSRLESGISYTEFSYMLLQAFDFLELHRREGVTLQIGGSDQWGNITAGIELIRRTVGATAHALTFPLMMTAAGTKFGKTEAGAIWLDPERTSPYEFYQFWVNVEDRDVGRLVRIFSLAGRAEIEALDAETESRPERRAAQQALAREVTARVHGEDAARVAAEVSAVLFGKGDVATLSRPALEALAREVPTVDVAAPADPPPEGAPAGSLDSLELFVAAGLAASRGAAKRLLEQGGMNVNGRRLAASDRWVRTDALLHGEFLVLRKGGRDYALGRVRV
jgi:tyrosyl-tRNA synthetase